MAQSTHNQSVGRAEAHESATGHVCGTAVYVDDLPTPSDTLHVATGYSEVPRGRLQGLALSQVAAAPGVVDVITAADIPGANEVGAVYPGDPLLATEQVLYAGQPLFAVAARSLRQAQQAARLAGIEIAPASPVLTIDDAHLTQSFVLPERHWRYGAEPAGEHLAHQIAGSLYIGGQEHFYLEGQVALAIPEEDDMMRVYSSTQHPDEVQQLVASVLGLSMHKVRVICRRMGGAFGGKESQAAPLACMAAVFARRLGRAVKYRMPRQDDMVQTGKRHDFSARYQLACDSGGMLQSVSMTLSGKCGHSPDLSEGIVDRAMFHATNAYYTPHAQISGYRCRTDTVSNTAFRGFGGPQGMLAMEAAMDELACASGIDPLALRLRNLYAPGREVTPYGQRVEQYVLADLMSKLATDADYHQRQSAIAEFNRSHRQFKKGLALTPVQFGISFTTTHLNQAGALVHVYRDGSVELNHAGTEMGQGLFTKMQQVAAETFGIPLEYIVLAATQTDKVPNGSPTAASSGADMNGMAVQAACSAIVERLCAFLVELGWNRSTIRFEHGAISDGENAIDFAELVRRAYLARVSLSATGYYRTPDIHFDKELGKGQPFFYFAGGAAACEVIIDTTTGEYRLLQVDILHDAGVSLNPALDMGQIEGGFMQGLGWLTTEELLWNDQGMLISNSPANYKIPTAHDCPERFNVAFYSNPNPQPTVHSSKATGEPPLMLPIAAWCALRSACGAAGNSNELPLLSVPATPEAVFWAVRQAKGEPRGER